MTLTDEQKYNMTPRQIGAWKALDEQLDDIDAKVFTGDLLQDDARRRLLTEYVERWTRALKEPT